MLMRQDHDYHHDASVLLESLEAVEEHRLSAHPAELLQLGAAGAGALSTGDDDHADVGFHWNIRENRSAIVFTPVALIPLGNRAGIERLDMNAV